MYSCFCKVRSGAPLSADASVAWAAVSSVDCFLACVNQLYEFRDEPDCLK